ncbi:hypothetical protein L21SP2_2993 [Salinispira pacifica]|uniref:Uncharacterized protein n=1 Tax=Salinispira pacifica TaxID=1307761 RepID=V5WLA8_9SPIO|nr:hypothetical protein L21SP2_2993 [Salinispira pacifica]
MFSETSCSAEDSIEIISPNESLCGRAEGSLQIRIHSIYTKKADPEGSAFFV